MKIALTGNPNSGKTTMYNALTGANEKVGNWAGVTVEKNERKVKKAYSKEGKVIAIDLPGAYSISPFTSEESITRDYIVNEAPDVIINIVDATNLSRSLFFTTQLLELGIPVVIALNKSDVNKKKGTVIDTKKLSERLGCPVVSTVSTSNSGLKELIECAGDVVGKGQKAAYSQAGADVLNKSELKEDDKRRFEFVNKIVSEVEIKKEQGLKKTLGDKIDVLLINRWLGIPFFALIMFAVFYISQTTLGTWIAEGYEFENGTVIPGLVTLLEAFQEWVRGFFATANPLLTALLVDGVIGGVVAVVGFLPLVMIMYFLIAILEDCGYMSRVAVVLDPIFKKVGLSGKSVIPFVISVGCAVPGIMASRTVHNDRERRATAMLAPFMPCGAKIPVIALFAGAFFDNAGWVSALMYLGGIVMIFFGALIVNLITGYKANKSYFIIELPDYKAPSLWDAFKSMISRGKAYVIKAATVILLCNTAVHIMQTFSWSFAEAQSADQSILASIAQPFAYLLFPIIGVVSWQLTAATVTGFIAKENVVGTLAVCFVGLENLIDAEALQLAEGAGAEVAGIMAITKAAALAFLVFNLYSPPCFAAIAAMSAEMKSSKWLWGGIALQLSMGFTAAYIVYTVGTLISSPQSLNITGAISGAIFIAAVVFIIAALISKSSKKEQKA